MLDSTMQERLDALIHTLKLSQDQLMQPYCKKQLCNSPRKKGDKTSPVIRGVLNISRATLDRWRWVPGFPRQVPGGHVKFILLEILVWMIRNP